ncbi:MULTISPECIES: hypothetical protein [unclassified Mesorhizobium]|uniref:hypothetical protein n=1 Tax=unclassified Mesorhizobium TaxID=325217 RepID=UPI0011295D2B|nr:MULTISPECIES: hypothetical protein [unclassified Mesorhizobium]TPK42642.1 hypothetical protein FJ550_29750 [Mesorhizobium sp. B2-5-2]TPL26762.1 hypothetical protein FJ946_13070 [Mesorhizobium sp. B2-4-7]TPL40540.1 hypothetical protein FJ961_17370 [Mesorhizobium sp. B2-4-5]TPM76814.1 hypothetical protein FJ968_03600 [Mesorhizobium sp. B2-1-6]TPN72477.1 hypothetical protein FJ985_29255 [Mesorhizobium sp. B1-1-2]
MTEIEVEGVGTYRLPNAWQSSRIGRMRSADRSVARLAFGCGMTVPQFRKLPQDRQQAVWQAYLALMSPTNAGGVPSSNDNEPAATRFRKGIHRSTGEKIAIGRRLIAVKTSLPRGHFGPWLEEKGIPAQFAHMVMKMAAQMKLAA